MSTRYRIDLPRNGSDGWYHYSHHSTYADASDALLKLKEEKGRRGRILEIQTEEKVVMTYEDLPKYKYVNHTASAELPGMTVYRIIYRMKGQENQWQRDNRLFDLFGDAIKSAKIIAENGQAARVLKETISILASADPIKEPADEQE